VAESTSGKTHFGSVTPTTSQPRNMRVKFEATDAAGKVHKRSSKSYFYSHCVVIHFAAHPPSKFWPEGVVACSHAEWVQSCVMAERKASRWRKKPDVAAIEILEARQV
jgi:hypothetical protein